MLVNTSNRQRKIRAKAAKRKTAALRPISSPVPGVVFDCHLFDHGTSFAVSITDTVTEWRTAVRTRVDMKWKHVDQLRGRMVRLLLQVRELRNAR